jgi:TldD protein
MNNFLEIAQQDLLAPAGLTEQELQKVLASVLGNSIDNADLYFQSTYSESWMLEDSIIKGGSYNIDRGVGVRAMSGEKTGFAYSDDIVMPALESAAQAARSISRQGGDKQIKVWEWTTGHELYLPVNPLISLSENEKVALLQRVDVYTRKLDPRVIQVNVSLAADYETMLVMVVVSTVMRAAADVLIIVRCWKTIRR